ncbi:TorF family putative porin [Gracilimonas sp.]|uniref:TorF family putative porin n=1 Tax=Gracilimonas sp. TaxID=1974203 RepID=UPI0032ED4EF4
MKTSNKISTILKALSLGFVIIMLFGLTDLNTVKAQEFSTGVDLYSTYVWRGVSYSGPSLQPAVEFSSGGFAIGAWGSQGYDGFQEMDLYAGYSFDFGLSLGVTDYWYPGAAGSGPWLDGDSHAYELNLGYSVEDFSLSGNYIFAGEGSVGNDIYFEASYSFNEASIFLGAGDGWHSSDTEFALVNVGVSTSKDIVITDTFTIPLSGAVIFNPDTEQLYILAGLSF